ncbi:phosphatidylinositol- -diphosphate 3-kinase, putative [Ichthyophthirius multifiliis]|uniref:phosphatidylinositol 3-kinase n=1 Tax=Ichthyophthirius multifiliis TaxID=5932 RepID=G0R577_ICHMU|nr:phosphatidylinositol- -diphosphate 3-kinase, putative [Ichthyophthirius multifiliis]EGR27401.1 phosphatidylinositol- -diphosphate 3-kinase, putative [Ichthyophthirius multifiliis]|eukprot:XP_004024285.1 phosphatidylinositol- -diphosphate 3-kinase, putative [Ichthyophthirius multifiliis]
MPKMLLKIYAIQSIQVTVHGYFNHNKQKDIKKGQFQVIYQIKTLVNILHIYVSRTYHQHLQMLIVQNQQLYLINISIYLKMLQFNKLMAPNGMENKQKLKADEVIKNILREIYKKSQIKLKPLNEDNQFILQIKGFREYLTGNHPMLSYDRVRINLRGHEHLDVKLTEIPINSQQSNQFPPIITRKTSDIEKNIYTPINWTDLYNVPILLWYPQVDLPPKGTPNPNQVLEESIKKLKKEKKKEKANEQQEYSNQYEYIKDIPCKEDVPMKDFASIRQNFGKISSKYLSSGECDCLFRIRVCGIQNLFKILEQINPDLKEHERATYNGIIQPTYITKTNQDEVLKHKKKKQEEWKEWTGVNQKQSNLKFAKTKREKQVDTHTFVTNHGIDGVSFMAGLEKKFGLNFTPYLISLKVMLYHGSICLKSQETKKVPFSRFCSFNEWITFDNLKISQLPLEARIRINIILHPDDQTDPQIIGSSVLWVFNEDGIFAQGLNALNVWPFYRVQDRLSCMNQYWGVPNIPKEMRPKAYPDQKEEEIVEQFVVNNFARLFIQLEKFIDILYYSLRDEKNMESVGFPKLSKKMKGDRFKNWNTTPKTDDLAHLQVLLNFDPLKRCEYTEEDKHILMICRNHYKTLTHALQIFLLAINWLDPEQVREAHNMLKHWTPLSPEDALPLLDANFANECVRLYAVERISTFSDDELALYMLELTQTLLYERKHYSPLTEMLLERSLQNPFVVGHEFFWQLKSQLHVKVFFERYSLLMEQFLMLCGSFRKELMIQCQVNDKLKKIGQECQAISDKDQQKKTARARLLEIRNDLPQKFTFALDSRVQVKNFKVEKCKCMDSKKVPLWIETQNIEEGDEGMSILFKCGDDIRQDQLTLQLLKVMDKIWLDAGHDFRMKPYKVITTDDQVGMIEIVLKSETTSKIHKKFGGVLGAFKANTIWQYLKEKNTDPHSFETATDNFLRSCAGYCVATYILGIGDRHADNIMLSYTGHLFHIDFGHFLGNFKFKYGIKRERAPFVFTKEMAFVMGGKDGTLFKKFEEYCTQAYNLVRKQGNFIINIFLLMLEAGMPELQFPHQIEYLKNQLSISLSEQEATNKFKKEIHDSLNSIFRRFDNFIHQLKRN